MPANQYDSFQSEPDKSVENSRPVPQAELPTPAISYEPIPAEPQREKQQKQEQSHGYGF